MLVGPDVEVLEANERALEFAGKDSEEVAGHYGGEVLECIHAALPGGCGKTVHCEACTIRMSVKKTYETGQSLLDVDSYQQVMTKDGLKTVHLKISTAKSADAVLLKIVPA